METLDDLKAALSKRLNFFCENGCRMSDIGIEGFPKEDKSCDAAETFKKALKGKTIPENEFRNFLFEMYVYLAHEYKAHNVTMQLHLNVKRNACTRLFETVGPDAGGDCVGDPIPEHEVAVLLDTMDRRDSLPHTILYTLEPSMYMALATTAGSFKGVVPGAAWWFCDHKRGMEEQLNIMAETGHLGQFTGMLTDSRSFLSYARHDYFRRVLCNRVAEELMDGTFLSEKAALKLLTDLCVENSRKLFGE